MARHGVDGARVHTLLGMVSVPHDSSLHIPTDHMWDSSEQCKRRCGTEIVGAYSQQQVVDGFIAANPEWLDPNFMTDSQSCV